MFTSNYIFVYLGKEKFGVTGTRGKSATSRTNECGVTEKSARIAKSS